ncbi:hypothetical protein MT344_02890 [Clavibacter michiganensis subsp. phaseoli]|uniref:hypothetical protein n=1 Tax=Clavibacter phaseoli TaxID=1734031 RepID=UPI001FB4E4DA|nr:hypothetical protein [Clavibacter phaseoli]MCJ1710130.1 hypothetical protein [Clavibacter phaseoli]
MQGDGLTLRRPRIRRAGRAPVARGASRRRPPVPWAAAPDHGWARQYEDRHPFAGGPDHRAAFLEDGERFKVELVTDS